LISRYDDSGCTVEAKKQSRKYIAKEKMIW
jgi:hypothetical protein